MKRAIGRPRRRDHPVRLHVRLPGALDRWLREYASDVELTRGAVIEQALASFRDAAATNAMRRGDLRKALAEHLRQP
jgi:predicted transcriptional regulator